MISQQQINTFQQDGVLLLKDIVTDWVDVIAAGIERNMAEPGEYASENAIPDGQGRFFDDYCNWTRIPEYQRLIRESPICC